ncbi:MAG: hypothetical protein RLZZ319_466, partial [Actinomycetota bacterium]
MTNTPASVTVAGNILKVATLNVSSEEAAIVELHRGMLGDPDWLIPISIAQKTYRAVYYGMTATALLEDVHFDSLANWLKRHRPQIPFVKPERGQLGDYNILGIDVSHKSMSGPTDTGVNWNALKAANNAAVNPNQVWVSQTPINV